MGKRSNYKINYYKQKKKGGGGLDWRSDSKIKVGVSELS